MSKKSSKPFTEADLKNMGMVEVSPNVFKKPEGGYERKLISEELIKESLESDSLSKKMINMINYDSTQKNESINDSHLYNKGTGNGLPDSSLFCYYAKSDKKLTIEIPGIVPGLNGKKGLIRSHWSNVKRQKKLYCQIIKDQLPKINYGIWIFDGPVTVEYILYKSSLYDWDNAAASFKHIGDSLVKCGVIEDDKPSIIREFIPKQIKCKRSEQKVVIIIKAFK